MSKSAIFYGSDGDGGTGFALVRTTSDGTLGVCVSLEPNGDAEVFLARAAAVELLNALSGLLAEPDVASEDRDV